MANSHMTFGVDLLPKTNAQYNLGNSSQKWNVWIDKINGTTPVTSVNNQTGDVTIEEQIIIVPITYTSGAYSITYSYDEIKSFIIANKIVILSYEGNFYYQRNNVIEENATPTLYFNNLNVNFGSQNYFQVYKSNNNITIVNRYTNSHQVVIYPFNYYCLVQNENNNYFISRDDYYDINNLVQDTAEFYVARTTEMSFILEKTGEISNGRKNYRQYFFNRQYFEIKEEPSDNYTYEYLEYIGIIELNNIQILRKILISGKRDYWEGVTVTVTDFSLGGEDGTVTSITPGNGLINGISGNSQAAITTAGTISIKEGGVTNDMLAGSISNDKLINHSITINNVTKNLGESFTTAEIGAAGGFEVVRLI